jgi:nitrite reductase/ring-hydroxylating ferredoxin subunit
MEGNMAEEQSPPAGPDLAQGVASSDFGGGTLLGHVGDQDVLLVRSGSAIYAIDAHCSHYHGPPGSWSATASAAPGIMRVSI